MRRNYFVRSWRWLTRSRSREAKHSLFTEFIYLDEISVVSLLVSREGELTEQIQEGRAYEESAGSELGGGIALKDSPSISAKSSFQSKSSQTVQATRKANIQSQFRRLKGQVAETGLVYPAKQSRKLRKVDDLLKDGAVSRPVSSLSRGDLLELDVRLEADESYATNSVMREIASLSEDIQIPGLDSSDPMISELKSYTKLVDHFMAGLVPIRCKVINVRLLDREGEKYLVESGCADRFELETSEVELVAVLDKECFWKDIRRVLFSSVKVTVLGRVVVGGVRDSWTPVKLLDLFADTVPGGDQVVSAFSQLRFGDMTGGRSEEDRGANAFVVALEKYVELWSAASDVSISEEDRALIDLTTLALAGEWRIADSRREAFGALAACLSDAGVTIVPEQDVEVRQAAIDFAKISVFGVPERDDNDADTPNNHAGEAAQLLEVDVIAIYW
ncbi:Uncharacterised protein (plasmid) [Tsukamurella tyrosinosolvens]|uniref:Uncharacterized protein n=1 Tax=Tsukamurella tyrosinosolvens TaxID=57704 RepID=A0A1H4WIC1_TSUTY|nr:hypothetical protein SAMN04489793_3564 [Tsukamurella tyrosinosolvens]VEH89358.1 Uncharacterised protein [Tsukamurella tyrosinosolvens]